MIQKKIADMATEIKAARLLVRDCAEALDSGGRCRLETSMAKMYASDVAQRAATEAVQIFGANGASDEFPVARAYRDAKIFQIVEGTNELHRDHHRQAAHRAGERKGTVGMKIGALATYVPAWARGGTASRGSRRGPGHDGGRGRPGALRRVLTPRYSASVIVTLDPGLLEGAATAVIARGLGMRRTDWVELRIGAAPAALDALLSAAPGTAVIAVDLPERRCLRRPRRPWRPGKG